MSNSPAIPAKVLFIASRAGIAGGEVYLLDVFRHLDAARLVPIVAVPAAGAFSEHLAQLDIETLVLDVDYSWLQPAQAWYPFLSGFEQRVKSLTEFIRQRGVALVHTNSNQIFEGAVAARLAGVHHVHVVHIPFQPHLQIYRRLPIDAATFAGWVGALSSAVVAVAEPVAASLCPPLAREQVTVIHNGIDLAPYDSARANADGHIRREFGIPHDAPLVVGVGRLHPDKGFESFLEAAALVLRSVPDAWFVIAGAADSQDYERALRKRMHDLGLIDRVRLVGQRADVPAILAEADVFLLTSLSEGGPYVLLEAAASGCACVASRCGGFVEHLVRPGVSGWLFDPKDSHTAAAQVVQALQDRELSARHVAAALRVVHSGEFDVRVSVARLEALYARVLALPFPPPGSPSLDVLLQAMREVGLLGAEVTRLSERMKRVERAADLLLNNPLANWLRRLRSRNAR